MIDLISDGIDRLTLLPLPTFVPRRYQPGRLANWSGHLAFANDLIANHRPSLLVELGTHYGESYFGMCQSVMSNGVSCTCYAVDHWLGEEHAGQYGEEVFAEVNEYNQRFYKSFSYLLRIAFDHARDQFGDNSIDLLHIDGLHTYEAGMHDFQLWYPKVKPGGIILFHDVMVRHADFGIWKVWEELQERYSETFTFHHSWGLGVLRKPEGPRNEAKFLELLFSSGEDVSEYIRRHYVFYSSHLDHLLMGADRSASGGEVQGVSDSSHAHKSLLKLYVYNESGYQEADSVSVYMETGVWSSLSLELRPGSLHGPIRFDPADIQCLVEIAQFEIFDSFTGERLLSLKEVSDLKQFDPIDSILYLPANDRCLLFCFGDDPKLLFRPTIEFEGAIRIQLSIKVEREMQDVANLLRVNLENASSVSALTAVVETLKNELRVSQSARMLLANEVSQFGTEKNALIRENRLLLNEKENEFRAAQDRARRLEQLLLDSDQQREQESKILQEENQRLTSLIGSVERSVSWRLTAPLRMVMRSLRGGRP